ncbi:MAG: alanine--tRNA ligase [bacterium]
MTGSEIRERFLQFFKQQGHTIRPSASLMPNDPTVLFTIAGMVPFKAFFLAQGELPFYRAASSQRCLRTNDIDEVGKTARHLTFFEMLGNFSFGDYFKEEAITWGWEFLTGEMKLPEEKLWVSVFKDDDESADLWHKKMGLPRERIVPLGEDNNFWKMGETGPCGPCSEILYDMGEEVGCGRPDCKVGCDCDRYLELWNLVFTQFDRDAEGRLHPLPKRNIDTGMGLERLAAVIQGVKTNFETDLLRLIINETAALSEKRYGQAGNIDCSLRIIADHMRAITFLIFDDLLPSNEGRGYVLRSLIRRAMRQGKILGLEGAFLYRLVDSVCRVMGLAELTNRREGISQIILTEEERFLSTLKQGTNILETLIEEHRREGRPTITGAEVFRLYDTYGFPVDLTREMAKEAGLSIDEAGFSEAMETQRRRARSAGLGPTKEVPVHVDAVIRAKTEFVGYERLETKARILEIIKEDKPRPEAREGEEVEIILDVSPFYGEGGGQIGDQGILTKEGVKVEIVDTQSTPYALLHQARIVSGWIKEGDEVTARVDRRRRMNIARNHTATHLLQAALREILGAHVKQAGSLVASDRLRFDFTHPSPLTDREIRRVEELVNERIRGNIPVSTFTTTLEEAREAGAMALFTEEYGDKVRVVKIGEVSLELCGGTHTQATGELSIFQLASETGVAAGIRRIEAITGEAAYQDIRKQQETINEIAERLKTEPDRVLEKVDQLVEETRTLKDNIGHLKQRLLAIRIEHLLTSVVTVEGIKLIAAEIEGMDMGSLREAADSLAAKLEGLSIVVLCSVQEGKVFWVTRVAKELTDRVHAGKLVGELAKITGGGGGGRPDFAQAGGRDPDKLHQALARTLEIVKSYLTVPPFFLTE